MDRNILSKSAIVDLLTVALRKESVDRNLSMGLDGRFKLVALRKESVDRNAQLRGTAARVCVALRKESVDRNIMKSINRSILLEVALRKESVDRNISREISLIRP